MGEILVIPVKKFASSVEIGKAVKVRAGYARNKLIPKGDAVLATSQNLAIFEQKREELLKQENIRRQQAEERAEQLKKLNLVIHANASDEGKLFGSVGVKEIVVVLAEHNFEVAKSEINLPNGAIHKVGDYEISFQLHSAVQVSIPLQIIAKKA